jgi:hypothetical protein
MIVNLEKGSFVPIPTLSFTESTKRVSVSTVTFPVTVKSFPTSTFAVVTRPVVALVSCMVSPVEAPTAVTAESAWYAAAVMVLILSAPPTSMFEVVTNPVVAFEN